MDEKHEAKVRSLDGADGVFGRLVRYAKAKLDGSNLQFYEASYVNLVLAGESERGTVALVAGSHTRSFPYFDTEPWDNCLLWIGDAGYTFTSRKQGASLRLEFDVEQAAPRGDIRFVGEMLRARDGRPVPIELEIAVALSPFRARLLGEPYNFLGLEGLQGMKWRPYELSGATGRVRMAGAETALSNVRGVCEHGLLTNVRAHTFAIKYDYVAVACPGESSYGLIQFTSHPLFSDGVLGKALDAYLRRSASVFLTIERGELTDGNPHGVYSPSQEDPAVALFENEVDLGPAVLKRQMIQTHDRSGHTLHGLREIFTAKSATHARTFHLNRTQVNALLLSLVVLDIVLSTITLGFPDRWFAFMHGLPYVDPAGLLRRTGAVWAAFVLLQAIALVRWQKQPYWLPLIAGVRLTELFSDWMTIFVAKHMTVLGTISLAIAPPANLVFGLILIATYQQRLRSGPLAGGSLFARPWS
jgi:hypothetical protein